MTGNDKIPTAGDAESIARKHWQLECQAEPLAGEVDRNFLLVTDSGDRWVLKISRQNTDRIGLDYQIETLRYLENSPVAHLVQRPLPTIDGQYLVPYERKGCEDCWVRVLSFLDGSPLVNTRERPPEFLQEIGRTLARLDLALRAFDHPGAHRDHPWNLERTDDLSRWAEQISEPARREMIERHMENFRHEVVPLLEGLEHGVIHNDANDHNLLVRMEADGQPVLAGLIDFGDSRYSITVAELAITAAYLMLDQDYPLTTDPGYENVKFSIHYNYSCTIAL